DVLDAGQFAGIDRLLDLNDTGAALARAKSHQDLVALAEWLVVKPENARVKPPRIGRSAPRVGNDIAPFDKEFAVERDADRTACGLRSRKRGHRPALDAFDFRDFS